MILQSVVDLAEYSCTKQLEVDFEIQYFGGNTSSASKEVPSLKIHLYMYTSDSCKVETPSFLFDRMRISRMTTT